VKRLAAVFGLSIGLFAGAAVLAAGPASAHPLGNFTVNRYSGLDLAPGRVTVTYVLDMAEIPTVSGDAGHRHERRRDGFPGRARRVGEPRSARDPVEPCAWRSAIGRSRFEPSPPPMVFRAGQAGLPILRLNATFAGPLGSSAGSVSYRDGNFADRIGWKEITARSERGISLSGLRVPSVSVSRTLLAYPKDLLSSPLDVTEVSCRGGPGCRFGASNSPASEQSWATCRRGEAAGDRGAGGAGAICGTPPSRTRHA